MESDKSRAEINERRKRANRRNINLSYGIIMLIVISFILIDYIYLSKVDEFSWQEFFSDIAGNLMGVMAAFVIFDIIHDKLSKDSYADEVSEQILNTLLGQDGIEALDEDIKRKFISASLRSLDTDEEAAEKISKALEEYLSQVGERYSVLERIDEFSDRKKKEFVRSNVESILEDPDASDMVQKFLDNYLKRNNRCRLRKNFSYDFILSASLPEEYNDLKHKEEYFLVHEMLTYDVKFLSEEMNNLKSEDGIVCLAFLYDNSNLDKFLRDSFSNQQQDKELGNCVFRESLCIDLEDIEYFSKLSKDVLKQKFQSMFKPHVAIDEEPKDLIEVEALHYGILAKFKASDSQTINPERNFHNIDIVFYMPKKWQGVLEVALFDPTKNPKVTVDYPENLMHVDMYSFLNDSHNTSYDNTHIEDNGMYRIMLNNTWVFPASGIVFTIEKKEDTSP